MVSSPRSPRWSTSRARTSRSWARAAVAVSVALGALVLAAPARAATTTVVSLTFDDGQSSQATIYPTLAAHGMNGTFYINSGLVGSGSYYMTWPQIQAIYNAGNEIGGHTLDHPDLTTLTTAQATTEICDDRTNLINQGLGPINNFAYPYGNTNASVESVVQSCGYSSGRGAGNLQTSWCSTCPLAESIPPADPYDLRTAEGVTTSTTLADLETDVTRAENSGGGWVILIFHGICDNRCAGDNDVSPSTFTSFLDWLQPRSANGTVVQTVGQVISGTPPPPSGPPATSISCNSAACSTGWYSSTVQVGLTATGSSTTTYYTVDGSDPTTSTTRVQYSNPFQVTQTTTVRYYSTNAAGSESPKSQTINIDGTAPTVSAVQTAKTSYSRRTDRTAVLQATAADTGTGSGAASGVAQVVFYDGNTAIGTATTPVSAGTFQVTWNIRNAKIGTHSLTAIATDAAGNPSARSSPVTVTIRN